MTILEQGEVDEQLRRHWEYPQFIFEGLGSETSSTNSSFLLIRILGKEQVMAQVVRSLPIMWETWIEFLLLDFSLV